MRHAIAEVHDVLEVRIEMRPPKDGEIGWVVGANDTEEEAMRNVLEGRDTIDNGAFGYGWVSCGDQPEFDINPQTGERYGRHVTISVEYTRSDLKGIKVL